MNISEALEDVEIASRQFEFAVKMLTYCELGQINPSDFDTDHVVKLPEGNLHMPSGHFQTTDDLNRAASVCVLLAFSAWVLALDQAFDCKGIKPDPVATDPDTGLRTIVYMLRCAHAHGIADPRWEVRGKFARMLNVDIDGETLSLDLAMLNGQVVEVGQIGGYRNWYRIFAASLRILNRP